MTYLISHRKYVEDKECLSMRLNVLRQMCEIQSKRLTLLMEKTYNAAGFIGTDFLGCMFWLPGISRSFHESIQNFSPLYFH